MSSALRSVPRPLLACAAVAQAALIVVAGLGQGAAAASGAPAHAGAAGAPTSAQAGAWRDSVAYSNRVVSSPTTGGGFPTPTGTYVPGTCREGRFDSNFSESMLAYRPGTEHLLGASKFFFDRYSTYYNFTTGTFDIGSGGSRSTPIGGYDCTTTGTQATPPTWTSTTDPNIAYDTRGRVHDMVLAFNAYRLDGNMYESHSDDNGHTWTKGNGGRPLQVGPVDAANGTYLDKPWVAVNTHRGSRYVDHVYGIWAVRRNHSSALKLTVSRDRGATYTRPLTLPTPAPLGATNPWPYVTVGADGTVYVVYISYAADGSSRFVTEQSRDDGRTWGTFRVAGPRTRVDLEDAYPGTKVHVGAPESFVASPDRPGHLYLAWEEYGSGRLGIRFVSSTDGGRTWSAPMRVNDDRSATDQVQPVVASGSRGAVAVAFYDKRLACPDASWVLPANRGRANTCFTVSLQPMRDTGARVVPVGGNRRLSARAWDPAQPDQTRDGLGQHPCDEADDPCTDIFVGDYFGLAITGQRVATLSVSTAPASGVLSDSGAPIHYQQQVLATVRRSDLGL